MESKKKEYILIGSGHDRQNHSALVKSLPQWVYDEDIFGANKADSEMGILIQAILALEESILALEEVILVQKVCLRLQVVALVPRLGQDLMKVHLPVVCKITK